MKKTKLESGITISPYIENEQRVIDGKIVYVTYNAVDWRKNFDVSRKNPQNNEKYH